MIPWTRPRFEAKVRMLDETWQSTAQCGHSKICLLSQYVKPKHVSIPAVPTVNAIVIKKLPRIMVLKLLGGRISYCQICTNGLRRETTLPWTFVQSPGSDLRYWLWKSYWTEFSGHSHHSALICYSSDLSAPGVEPWPECLIVKCNMTTYSQEAWRGPHRWGWTAVLSMIDA